MAEADPSGLPAGASLSLAGFLTIDSVPPSPYPDDPPPEPPHGDDVLRRLASPDPAVRRQAEQEANGSAAFQAELQRLAQLLPQAEPDNFVQARMVRDPAAAAEIWFERDASATLARYTSDPLFRAREGGMGMTEQQRLVSLWGHRAQESDAIDALSLDPIAGTVVLSVVVGEAEFRRIADKRGWELGPEIRPGFPLGQPAAFADRALAPLVRVFARETRPKTLQLEAGFSGRIVLADGCFRLGGPTGALVQFGRQTQLTRDAQGYLALVSRGGRYLYRIGEIGSWPGPNEVDDNDPEVLRLREQCGGGPVVNVAEPESERLFYAPDAARLSDYARAKSLSYGAAWDEVIACIGREERPGEERFEATNRCLR